MTEIELCNLALARIGEVVIHTLDDSSVEARKCKLLLPFAANEVLRSGIWSAAREFAVLPKLKEKPLFGFQNAFQLPADCLRVVQVNAGQWPWKRAGDSIYTDAGRVQLEYIKKISVVEMDELLAEALSVLLASRLAVAVKGDANASQALLQEYYQIAKAQASSVDARENKPRTAIRNSAWDMAKMAGHKFSYEDSPWL